MKKEAGHPLTQAETEFKSIQDKIRSLEDKIASHNNIVVPQGSDNALRLLAIDLEMQGDTQYNIKHYEQASLLFQEAIASRHKIHPAQRSDKDLISLSNCQSSLGSCHLGLEQYEHAIKLFQEAIASFNKFTVTQKSIQGLQSQAARQATLGSCCYYLKQYKKAINSYDDAITSIKKMNTPTTESVRILSAIKSSLATCILTVENEDFDLDKGRDLLIDAMRDISPLKKKAKIVSVLQKCNATFIENSEEARTMNDIGELISQSKTDNDTIMRWLLLWDNIKKNKLSWSMKIVRALSPYIKSLFHDNERFIVQLDKFLAIPPLQSLCIPDSIIDLSRQNEALRKRIEALEKKLSQKTDLPQKNDGRFFSDSKNKQPDQGAEKRKRSDHPVDNDNNTGFQREEPRKK